jgi:hypothetical protein
MSITPTTPRDPLPPPATRALESRELYDASNWESAYRHFDEDAVPQLLLHLQDDLTRARRREAAWLSVIVHLLVIILFVNQPKIEGFYRRVFLHQQPVMALTIPDLVQKRELTVLELPPDAQRVIKRPNTNMLSDKDRIATTRTPQIDPKELRKLMASAHPGMPGSNVPGPQPGQTAAQSTPQAQQDTQAQHLGEQAQAPASQLPQLQSPVTSPPSPQIKFGGAMSPGSAIEQAARAAAQNRGAGYGDGGDYGLSQGQNGGTLGNVDILSDTMGFDFDPYLHRIFVTVDRNWRLLMPDSVYPPILKKGYVYIEFSIMKDGTVQGMRNVPLPQSDVALERAAWGSITNSAPFPPLPNGFPGQYLELRFKYFYNLNPDGSEVH